MLDEAEVERLCLEVEEMREAHQRRLQEEQEAREREAEDHNIWFTPEAVEVGQSEDV